MRVTISYLVIIPLLLVKADRLDLDHAGLNFPPDLEDFPVQLNSTNCGDVLVAQGGFINYQYNELYKNNERCIWTLRTPRWQTSFLMHSAGFHSVNDYLAVYVLDSDGALIQKGRIDSKTGSQIVGAIGPTVFLAFVTDETGIGTGFHLEYFGFGYLEMSGFEYDHSHFALPSGYLTWPGKPVDFMRNAFVTFTLSSQVSSANDGLSLTVNEVDLITLKRGCQHNFLSVHQLLQDGFTLRLRYCEADFQALARISASSPLLVTYAATIGPQQKGVSFSWNPTGKQ